MAVIVLVHGIAQELRKPGELEAEWIPPAKTGATKRWLSRHC